MGHDMHRNEGLNVSTGSVSGGALQVARNRMITKKRIFWLGMHKVLSQTELPHLRALGYEVFNPPYLSSVYLTVVDRADGGG